MKRLSIILLVFITVGCEVALEKPLCDKTNFEDVKGLYNATLVPLPLPHELGKEKPRVDDYGTIQQVDKGRFHAADVQGRVKNKAGNLPYQTCRIGSRWVLEMALTDGGDVYWVPYSLSPYYLHPSKPNYLSTFQLVPLKADEVALKRDNISFTDNGRDMVIIKNKGLDAKDTVEYLNPRYTDKADNLNVQTFVNVK